MTPSEQRSALEAAQVEHRELARTLESDSVLQEEAAVLARDLAAAKAELDALEQAVLQLRASQAEQQREAVRIDEHFLGEAEPYEWVGRRGRKRKRTLRNDHVLFGAMAGALWATGWFVLPGVPLMASGAVALLPCLLSALAFIRRHPR